MHKKVHTKPKKFEIMWTKSSMVIIQMKATKKYSSVGLFIVLNKVVLTFESACAWQILKCDHSNESYWAVLSCGAVYYHDDDNELYLSV